MLASQVRVNIEVFRRYLVFLAQEGKGGDYDIAMLLPTPPGQSLVTVKDLRDILDLAEISLVRLPFPPE